ncbi:hypothetical protein GAYE_SCF55G6279 [Galdieria yellowstonensis]|uniref:Transducin family protein / WD-40 repeat family protein n=1 Tax=Galdieria yellowstonensis TaxID=3028027 RepID=A0AAV9IM35_9RHOD|nr:hypothetical protein GAYE_SCF55G6279 [Galdieria yellowstonensis]
MSEREEEPEEVNRIYVSDEALFPGDWLTYAETLEAQEEFGIDIDDGSSLEEYVPLRSAEQTTAGLDSSWAGLEWLDREVCELLEVKAEEAAVGRDVQGIPWYQLPYSREDFRRFRLQQNLSEKLTRNELFDDRSKATCDFSKPSSRCFFRFFHFTRRVRCSISHYQLRHLVWAPYPHQVYTQHERAVARWDVLRKQRKNVLHYSQLQGTFIESGAMSMCVGRNNILVLGGRCGEIAMFHLGWNQILKEFYSSEDDNAIVNALNIVEDSNNMFGRLYCCSNDCFVRFYDLSVLELETSIHFPFAVNHASLHPDGNLLVVGGDDTRVLVYDLRANSVAQTLYGHSDYTFSTSWHPEGILFATGNQDLTCRIWDSRVADRGPIHTLPARMDAVRSVRFSPNGRYFAMAEHTDFVHIYDLSRRAFEEREEVDVFGDISGVAFTKDCESIFIGIRDNEYGGIMELEREKYDILNVLNKPTRR